MNDVITVLRRAGDLALLYGPNPVSCIRAAALGAPDAVMPFYGTPESELAEDAEYRLQRHINPGSVDADEDDTVDEWAAGRSVADVRGAFFAAADGLEAGVL
ncbi:hypothetical protein [Streptomyces sp. NPDC005303]|uniref:hypothetical protein n=1 Tax=Streptomyces sp. NPDC005303 TaxID=3155713 RepID=UPI0033AA6FA8